LRKASRRVVQSAVFLFFMGKQATSGCHDQCNQRLLGVNFSSASGRGEMRWLRAGPTADHHCEPFRPAPISRRTFSCARAAGSCATPMRHPVSRPRAAQHQLAEVGLSTTTQAIGARPRQEASPWCLRHPLCAPAMTSPGAIRGCKGAARKLTAQTAKLAHVSTYCTFLFK
jgi:hypothetical protein